MFRWRNRKLKDIPKDARKSLEVLDKVLEQIEKENKFHKQNSVRRNSLGNSSVQDTPNKGQEDIRRSLEILDNVLAEFDDSGYFFADNNCNDQTSDDVILRSRRITDTSDFGSSKSSLDSFRTCSTDGSTSQSLSNQSKRFSPPPVPKRSPGTRLSAKESPLGSPTSCGAPDIPTPTSSDKDNRKTNLGSDETNCRDRDRAPVSEQLVLSPGLDFCRSNITPDACCHRCGCLLLTENAPSKMLARSPSVAVRRQQFEGKSPGLSRGGHRKKFLNSDSGIDILPVTNSPFLSKNRIDVEKIPSANRLTNSASDSKINEMGRQSDTPVPVRSQRPVCRCHSVDQQEKSQIVSGVLSDRTNLADPNLSADERLRRLDKRFAEIKRLLKEKKIRALTQKPPNFVPPPPPKPPRKSKTASLSSSPGSSGSPASDHKSYLGEVDADETNKSVRLSNSHDADDNDKSVHLPNGHKIEPLSHTIKDLPKLLPTDALLRPQYGLSYTLEDDLSPGVKEILTSTPKPDKIQLSTFSQSVSSLGYGSSQSEQELNLSFENSDKVPVATLKSQTLPIGIRMVPPLACVEDLDSDSCELHHSFDLFRPEEDHFRSSSAPPLKHLLKPKSAFGMSKKDKHRTKNGEDGISKKFNSSAEECSRRSPRDGSTVSDPSDLKGKETPPEGKRRSVWKSILRRK